MQQFSWHYWTEAWIGIGLLDQQGIDSQMGGFPAQTFNNTYTAKPKSSGRVEECQIGNVDSLTSRANLEPAYALQPWWPIQPERMQIKTIVPVRRFRR